MGKMKSKQCWILLVAVMMFVASGLFAYGEQDSLRLQKDVAKAAIRLGDEADAENAIAKLKADFAGDDRLAKSISEIAREYRDTHKFDKACELYKYIQGNWPSDKEALLAQVRLIKIYNEQGDTTTAGAAFDELFCDFKSHEKMDEAACEIGDYFSEYQQYEKARQGYKYVVDNCPDSGYMRQALSGLAKANIYLGDEVAAQAAIERLKAGFSSDEGIARSVCQIGACYHFVGQHEKAEQLYGYVLSLSGLGQTDKVMIWKQTCLALSQMCQEDKVASQATLDKLCVDFNNPEMSRALHAVAEICYKEKDYQRAAGIWRVMLEKYPGKTFARDMILCLKGFCHANLKEYTQAIECYGKIATDYPQGPFARRISYQIGMLYKQSGNYSEAISWLRRQYELYPDGVLAEKAMFDSGLIYQFKIKDYSSAIEVFQEYMNLYSANDRAALVLYNMALCYKNMDDVPQAIAMLSQAQAQYPESVYSHDIAEQNAKLSGGAN